MIIFYVPLQYVSYIIHYPNIVSLYRTLTLRFDQCHCDILNPLQFYATHLEDPLHLVTVLLEGGGADQRLLLLLEGQVPLLTHVVTCTLQHRQLCSQATVVCNKTYTL